MFFHTDTADAPLDGDSRTAKSARLNAMRYVLHKMPYTKRLAAVWQPGMR